MPPRAAAPPPRAGARFPRRPRPASTGCHPLSVPFLGAETRGAVAPAPDWGGGQGGAGGGGAATGTAVAAGGLAAAGAAAGGGRAAACNRAAASGGGKGVACGEEAPADGSGEAAGGAAAVSATGGGVGSADAAAAACARREVTRWFQSPCWSTDAGSGVAAAAAGAPPNSRGLERARVAKYGARLADAAAAQYLSRSGESTQPDAGCPARRQCRQAK